jgi:hypothetical protein
MSLKFFATLPGEVGCAKWPVKQSEEKMRAKIGRRAIGHYRSHRNSYGNLTMKS